MQIPPPPEGGGELGALHRTPGWATLRVPAGACGPDLQKGCESQGSLEPQSQLEGCQLRVPQFSVEETQLWRAGPAPGSQDGAGLGPAPVGGLLWQGSGEVGTEDARCGRRPGLGGEQVLGGWCSLREGPWWAYRQALGGCGAVCPSSPPEPQDRCSPQACPSPLWDRVSSVGVGVGMISSSR